VAAVIHGQKTPVVVAVRANRNDQPGVGQVSGILIQDAVGIELDLVLRKAPVMEVKLAARRGADSQEVTRFSAAPGRRLSATRPTGT
jgi:hypothetical protein